MAKAKVTPTTKRSSRELLNDEKGTSRSIFRVALLRVDVWLFLVLHVTLFVLQELEFLGGTAHGFLPPREVGRYTLSFPATSLSSWLMGLLLTAYVAVGFRRFEEFNRAFAGMARSLHEAAQLTAALGCPADLRWDVSRYLLASATLEHYSAAHAHARPSSKSGEGEEADGIGEEAWERMLLSEEDWLRGRASKEASAEVAPPMLLEAEVEALRRCKGRESLVLQGWAMQALSRHVSRSAPQQLTPISDAIRGFRSSCSALSSAIAAPVPSYCHHVLLVLMWTCYAMYAFTLLSLSSYLAPPAMLLILLTTAAARELGSALCSPFGSLAASSLSRRVHDLRCTVSFVTLSPDAALPSTAYRGGAGRGGDLVGVSISPPRLISPTLTTPTMGRAPRLIEALGGSEAEQPLEPPKPPPAGRGASGHHRHHDARHGDDEYDYYSDDAGMDAGPPPTPAAPATPTISRDQLRHGDPTWVSPQGSPARPQAAAPNPFDEGSPTLYIPPPPERSPAPPFCAASSWAGLSAAHRREFRQRKMELRASQSDSAAGMEELLASFRSRASAASARSVSFADAPRKEPTFEVWRGGDDKAAIAPPPVADEAPRRVRSRRYEQPE